MKHTLFRAVVLLATAALALAACAQPTPAPAPTEPPPAQATSEEPMAEEPTAEPPMAEEVTVVIGFTSSLTGSQEVSSKRQVNGFNLWMEQLNAAGGITLSDGTVVTFAASTYDDESNAERVQELYTRLITEDNADFLISPYSSGLTSAASIVAEQNGKVMITTGAADDSAYKTGNTSLFQLYTPGSLYMSSTVDMLQEIDPDAKIALVHESDKFSTSVIEGIKPYLAARNFEVVLEEGYASDTADFGPIVNKIAGSGATVLLDGRDITRLAPYQKAELGLVLVPEGRQLFTDMTVHENLDMGATNHKARPHRERNLERVFELFPRLKERRKQRAGTLSGGEQQMLAVARGLMAEPRILMIDELSLGLAPVLVIDLFSTLEKLKGEGLTMLLVEQNVHMALAVSDYAYVLSEGKVTLRGEPEELAQNQQVQTSYLGI